MSRFNTRKNRQFGFCYYLPGRFLGVQQNIRMCIKNKWFITKNKSTAFLKPGSSMPTASQILLM